jgi:hypothetical protein
MYSTWKWIINPVTWRKYNPFQISYKTFMTTLRNPTIPVIDRKQYFFLHCDPYMDYISKPEHQSDLTFISNLLSSSVHQPKKNVATAYTQTEDEPILDEEMKDDEENDKNVKNVKNDPDEENEEYKNENDKKRQIECIL